MNFAKLKGAIFCFKFSKFMTFATYKVLRQIHKKQPSLALRFREGMSGLKMIDSAQNNT